ncbi:MAG: TonB-dependent receptor [Proteobacteria bacterium]|nr:TonB-dependent receptor [Pseudomonadota bacterium]
MRYLERLDSYRQGLSLVACAVAAILGAHAALAQTAPPQPAAQASEPAATGVLQEITVTATRREESLSKVPVSVVALTQESLDNRGIKDFSEVARFTPGVNFDTSGTNNISIRGISGTGGAGTTGIYLDDTPIQMRALAFSPDEALPKSFDIARVEVLRGPQGTLFGSGSEGGTVRYITVQPSVSKSSMYARAELSTTEGGAPSYEAGVAAGGPLVDGTFGARLAVWYRRDGGWIDHMDPVSHDITGHNTNYADTMLLRLSTLWQVNDKWSLTPSVSYQNQKRNAVNNFWPLYSNPGSNRFVSADPSERHVPDKFYLAALKVEGDLGFAQLISNTSYYHRREQTGYEGTLYNLGFYQSQNTAPVFPLSGFLPGVPFPLLDGNGIHLPAGATDYLSPSSIDNGQMNFTQEIRLQSSDPSSRLLWTAGLFYNNNRQSYLEQIHDPHLNELTMAVLGLPYTDVFVDANLNPVPYVPGYPFDSYFLNTRSKDEQYAVFGEGTFSFTDQWKLTLGARYARSKYSFDTNTGGPQLFAPPTHNTGDNSENSFTPKVSLQYQMDQRNMFYATYAKGFRPGGANNPLPIAACYSDLVAFGIPAGAPTTFKSDTVQSYEVGAKNNLGGRVRIASSVYYIRWHNIQQTVLPPICQISFIDNLGEAVAKGVDLEAEVQVTDALSAQIAAGYTSARYSQDSRLNPTGTSLPVVANGDAIVGQTSEAGGGQPTAPVTVTAGLEYRFSAFNHESFVRGDVEYQGRGKWAVPGQDPGTLQYDPGNRMLAGTVFSSLRAGMQFGDVSVAAFVDNLTNTHALTDYNNTICSTPQVNCAPNNPGSSRLERDYTFRPRTYGVTVIYKK